MKTFVKELLTLTIYATISHAAFSQGKAIYYYNPQWSPDGSSIVFESNRDGGKSSIYTMSPDGNNIRKITDTLFDYGQPSWSADGKHLVYYGSDHPMQLFINSNQGSAQKQLPTPGLDAYEPSWSSQNKIAFDSKPLNTVPNEIAVMNADGTGFAKLTSSAKYDCSSPQWSPDGKKILFQRSLSIHKQWKDITKEEMEQKQKSAELMIMNADGSDARTLVSYIGSEVALTWSHDGKTIYYITKKDQAVILYKMSIDKSSAELVLTLSGTIYSISVSPDEKLVLYAAEREKKHAVYVQDLKTKTERNILGN